VRKVSEQERRRILYPECRIEKKKVIELERSSISHKEKTTARWYMDRNSERCNKRER